MFGKRNHRCLSLVLLTYWPPIRPQFPTEGRTWWSPTPLTTIQLQIQHKSLISCIRYDSYNQTSKLYSFLWLIKQLFFFWKKSSPSNFSLLGIIFQPYRNIYFMTAYISGGMKPSAGFLANLIWKRLLQKAPILKLDPAFFKLWKPTHHSTSLSAAACRASVVRFM